VRIATALAGPRRLCCSLVLLTLAAVLFTGPVCAQPDRSPANRDAILLTIFLKHDQSKTLDEIQGGSRGVLPPPVRKLNRQFPVLPD